MENGSFPKTEKEASVKPTLKSGKNQQNVESYRPISNLSFLGKTIETAAKKQLIAHMEALNVLPEDQSAYSEFNSTETALCSIVSDLLEYMDNGKCAILILLDLSAASDTVDHKLLIDDLMYIIDNNLTCNEQIQTVIKNANFTLRNIAFIKKYPDDDSMKKLVHNYIITRLDYCNSLYHKLPAYPLKKLQLVFNRVARLIVGTAPRERITPVLIDLHWLPIKA